MQPRHSPARNTRISECRLILAATALLALVNGQAVSAGNDDAPSHGARTYTGFFLGSGLVGNEIVDIEGFANWGQPGYTLDYGDNRILGGALMGTKVRLRGVRVRIEVDGTFGDLSGKSNQLDPSGLDETAGSEMSWIATARAGFEQPVGGATVFATGGLAVTRITNFVTDIDSGRNILPHVDPDDSFRHSSTRLGPVFGAGIEAPLAGAWRLRVEGSFLDFGWSTHNVNHSGNNRCGPGNPRRPCPYDVRDQLGIIRFGLIHRLGR